jgi:hypothetical protein
MARRAIVNGLALGWLLACSGSQHPGSVSDPCKREVSECLKSCDANAATGTDVENQDSETKATLGNSCEQECYARCR